MTLDTNWVLLITVLLVALVALRRVQLTAKSRDRKMDLDFRKAMELNREETIRLQLLVKSCGLDDKGGEIERRRWWPDPNLDLQPPPAGRT